MLETLMELGKLFSTAHCVHRNQIHQQLQPVSVCRWSRFISAAFLNTHQFLRALIIFTWYCFCSWSTMNRQLQSWQEIWDICATSDVNQTVTVKLQSDAFLEEMFRCFWSCRTLTCIVFLILTGHSEIRWLCKTKRDELTCTLCRAPGSGRSCRRRRTGGSGCPPASRMETWLQTGCRPRSSGEFLWHRERHASVGRARFNKSFGQLHSFRNTRNGTSR